MKIVAIAMGVLLTVASCFAADPVLAPGPKDKCAVCGMFVAEFKAWVASVEYKGGGRAYFDGPKDLFAYLGDLKKYAPGRNSADIERILVTDYYSTKAVAAREAFFVAGSDVMGPMGTELVPFISKTEAAAFLADHKGKKVLTFDEVTPAVLESLQ